jgi:hypothetical protein
MDDIHILQDRNFGLGNFINLTPTIKALSEHLDMKIPVYFELDHVKQCFIDCDFMEILEKQPFDKPLFSSAMVDFRNRIPDWVYVYRETSKLFNLNPDAPHTYVDRASEIDGIDKPYTLFMYGSGNEDKLYMNTKSPDKSYYTDYMNGKCIFTGSEVDYNRERWFNHMDHYLNDIRKSLALIRDATLIISNDTGLAHAAGAMNKNIIILWKDSALPKNGNPGENTLIKLVR